jgi:hypothetical protein
MHGQKNIKFYNTLTSYISLHKVVYFAALWIDIQPYVCFNKVVYKLQAMCHAPYGVRNHLYMYAVERENNF